jgi:hypothetical protein
MNATNSIGNNKEGEDTPESVPNRLHPRRRDSEDEGWTPHRKMNFVVYIVIFSVAYFILDREYGGFLTIWLRMYFPRESAALGFQMDRGAP